MKLKKLLAAVTAAALAVSTMAVTSFTASAADPVVEVTWTNESNVYTGVAVARPSNYGDSDPWGGGGTTGNVDYTDIIPSSVSVADIRKVTVNFEVEGSANGSAGCNVATETGEPNYGSWTSDDWNVADEGKGIAEKLTATFDAPYGIPNGQSLQVQLYWINFGTTVTATVTVTDKDGNVYPSDTTSDDDLPTDEWFRNDDGYDVYICTNGNAPDLALSVDVEELLDDGKTLADVSKITAVYAVSSLFDAEQGVSGCFGVVHSGEPSYDDNIYAEWAWAASDSTAEEGKDCVIECADGLLDTDECQFQIDEMKANNILVVQFVVEYTEDDGGEDDGQGGDIDVVFSDQEQTLTIGKASWGEPYGYTTAAQANIGISAPTGITYGTTTYADVKGKTINLNDIVF